MSYYPLLDIYVGKRKPIPVKTFGEIILTHVQFHSLLMNTCVILQLVKILL